jgi:hypothetical protein
MFGVPVVDSPAAQHALEVASALQSPALLAHCRRSYVFAAAYGLSHDVAFDAELLYVAAMLHDLGLAAVFDSATVDFEVAGGQVAWVFAAGAGWPTERRTRLAEVIERHMWPAVDPAVDPEGHLLEVATSLDISGADAAAWPPELRTAVVAEFPRHGLAEEFLRCFRDQATRKPGSSAARSVANGIADRIRANPLDG